MTGVIPFLIFLNTQWANFIKDTPKDVQYTPEQQDFGIRDLRRLETSKTMEVFVYIGNQV